MMRYLIFALFALFMGCGDAAEPVDEYTQADAEGSCAEKNEAMAVVLGCHICDESDSCLSDPDRHYYWRAFDDDGQWTCQATPVVREDLPTLRDEMCNWFE